jgi:hypothetical protein
MNGVGEYLAVGISLITLLVLIGEKLFGGGNALAQKFADLDRNTSNNVATAEREMRQRTEKLERELTARVDSYEDNYSVGAEALRSNIHAMQIALLEFRAKMAEEYMPKKEYFAATGEIKAQIQQSFAKLESRLERMEEGIHHLPGGARQVNRG